MARTALDGSTPSSVAAAGRDAPRALGAAPLKPVTQSVAEVYERHFGYVVRCLAHLGVHAEFLEDATQDVFVVVHAKLDDFDGRVALTTWLSAIVLRVAYRYRAKQTRAAQYESDESLTDHQSPEADAMARARLELAKQALDALDDAKREVFVLSELEEMSAPEIASITGVPLNTVYSRLRVAKQSFAAALHRLKLRGRSS